jgi:hypothetical protein
VRCYAIKNIWGAHQSSLLITLHISHSIFDSEVISWYSLSRLITSTWCGGTYRRHRPLEYALDLQHCFRASSANSTIPVETWIAERNCKLDPVPDISPDGDVVLVVGPRNVRLRIQSQVLRCASKGEEPNCLVSG